MKKRISLEHTIKNVHANPQYKKVNEDFEHEMARNELETAHRAIRRLMKHLGGEGDIEAWVQSKITKGSDYLDTVADYMDSQKKTDDVEEAYRYEVTDKAGKKYQGVVNTNKDKTAEEEAQKHAIAASKGKSYGNMKIVTKKVDEAVGVEGSDKFHGSQFNNPVPLIGPGHSQSSKKASSVRKSVKEKGSMTLHNKVNEESDAVPEGTKYRTSLAAAIVGRPQQGREKLAKQAQIKTKIIDEQKKLAIKVKEVVKKKVEGESSGGETEVIFNPPEKKKTFYEDSAWYKPWTWGGSGASKTDQAKALGRGGIVGLTGNQAPISSDERTDIERAMAASAARRFGGSRGPVGQQITKKTQETEPARQASFQQAADAERKELERLKAAAPEAFKAGEIAGEYGPTAIGGAAAARAAVKAATTTGVKSAVVPGAIAGLSAADLATAGSKEDEKPEPPKTQETPRPPSQPPAAEPPKSGAPIPPPAKVEPPKPSGAQPPAPTNPPQPPKPPQPARQPVQAAKGEGKIGTNLASMGVSREQRRNQEFVNQTLGAGKYTAGTAESNIALQKHFASQSKSGAAEPAPTSPPQPSKPPEQPKTPETSEQESGGKKKKVNESVLIQVFLDRNKNK